MRRLYRKLMLKGMAFLLCIAMLFEIFPVSTIVAETSLPNPISVSITDLTGASILEGQKIGIDDKFYITFDFGVVDNIDSSIKYNLPGLSNYLDVAHTSAQEETVSINIIAGDSQRLGELVVDRKNGGKMTFQFDDRFNGHAIDDFLLTFTVQLDGESITDGSDITISFPIQGGETNLTVTVVDKNKTPPKITKSGQRFEDESNAGNVEILWTVTITNTDNPHPSISTHDEWSSNQEYVDGSFCVDGVPTTTGLTVKENGFTYEQDGIVAKQVNVLTYRTRIKSDAFLKDGLPMTSGNITCTNSAQVFYPGESSVPLTSEVKSTYTHPITWLYKTSGNVLNRETGEMEWTVMIYNNGLSMQNVIFYDRLSPGVSIKDNSAEMTIGGTTTTLTNFVRNPGEDVLYDSDSKKAYNLSYNLGNIGSVAVIKYHTIITNMDEYDAGAYLPPDSIYDNRAFITYQIPAGVDGLSSLITSPVVEKSGGYDEGLIGKTGSIETAYHTIKWTMTVNKNDETLKGVTITDRLTYAAPVTSVPTRYQLCNHVYDDSIQRNRPQYSYDGKNFSDFTAYDATNPTKAFTYQLVPNENGVLEVVFYLGDINKKVMVVFRSTATDEIIYANNVANSNCGYENKATLVTDDNAFSYTSASVTYKSNVYQKDPAASYSNKQEHTYNFEKNQFPWRMVVNTNQMSLTDICVSDILNEGTSLVEGTLILGVGNAAWYRLATSAGTLTVPKYTAGASKPYYTYNEVSRELKIYLADIVGSEVGTTNATKQIVFYVQVDVEHEVFNNPDYPGYILNNKGIWQIPNTGKLETNYFNGLNAIEDGASYNVYVKHLSKVGTAFKNGTAYSIDYSLSINRIQQQLTVPAVVQDIIPVGLRLDASTVHLYEATVTTPDMFYVKDDGTNGTVVKGAEVDSEKYQIETAIGSDGKTTMRVILPEDSGKKIYVLEYSCDVTDVSKAPFTNSASLEGVELSSADQTTSKLVLTNAAGGGTLRGAKTKVNLSKKDSVTGNPIQGAIFGIYYDGLLIEKKTTDINGAIVFENLNKNYTYTITELESASGYLSPIQLSRTFVATDISTPVTLDFENDPILGTARFIKVGQDEIPLSGAVFGLWENEADVSVGTPVATATSGHNGVVSFTSLTAGKTYYIAEITPPDDYKKSNEVILVKMGIDGGVEKLWLKSDLTETAITTFENIPIDPIVYTSITVVKEWNDNNNPSRPELVSIQLYRDGVAFEEAVLLDKENNWTATWNELNDKHVWTVAELNVPSGYIATVHHEGTRWTITNRLSSISVPVSSENSNNPENFTVPLTADETNRIFWMALLAISLLGLCGCCSSILWSRIKKRKSS